MAAGLPLPGQGLRARLAARRRREDEQDQADRHRPGADHRPLRRRTRSATTSCARSSSAQDGSFSWEDMSARYTAELANGLGNLASRVAAMVGKYFGGVLPAPAAYANADLALGDALRTAVEDADAAILEAGLHGGHRRDVGVRRRGQPLRHRAGAVEGRQDARRPGRPGAPGDRALHHRRVAAGDRRAAQPRDAARDGHALGVDRRR